MVKVYLSLGSNLGERESYLQRALNALAPILGPTMRCSSIYESEPWGFESSNSFLNMVVSGRVNLSPEKLLEEIQSIEKSLGRNRAEEQRGRGMSRYSSREEDNQRDRPRYNSRVIDIDILYYGDKVVNKENLQIPHPQIERRKFVLTPLAQLSPSFKDPITGKTITQLLEECEDSSTLTISPQSF